MQQKKKICYDLGVEANTLLYWQREADGISADGYVPIG